MPSSRPQAAVHQARPSLLALSVFCAAWLGPLAISQAQSDERPNIVWISCEDISPHLGCYGDPDAVTPNLDRLAQAGTRFNRAYSCHGVCAPSRTGIITGMFPIALGANHMRSKVPLPENIKLFPQLLREAGYYCSNNSKTDYNVIWHQKHVWDDSSGTAHWKNRPSPGQPFFAVFNLTMTHESKVWQKGWEDIVTRLPADQRHQPNAIHIPPLYPDRPAVREDFARLADLITVMDQRAGELLQELDDAGLTDNTIVMFWSDHGNGLPRAKRWTYESGSRVPLIIRSPARLRATANFGEPGTVDDRMVQLIDLGPTVLSLAGIPVPNHMHGKALHGPDRVAGCSLIAGARDRIDERLDLVRTIRDERFRYVRNLMPWHATLQPITYAEQNASLTEMRRMLAAGSLPPAQAQWFTLPRAPEELYDVVADPCELTNLAGQPDVAEHLDRLRAECDRWQIETRDLHLIPEILLAEAEANGQSRTEILTGDAGRERTRRLLQAAKQAAALDATTAMTVAESLSDDPAERWWQVTLMAEAPLVEQRLKSLQREVGHPQAVIRIAAAGGLARGGFPAEAAPILEEALQSHNSFVRHAAMLQIDQSGPPVINLLRPIIADAGQSTTGKQEYIERLIEHALAQ